MLHISHKQLQIITSHGEKTYPEECCGLILGEITPEGKVVRQVWQTENSWEPSQELLLYGETGVNQGSKRNRFSIAPETMLKAQKVARQKNLTVIGIYHSHPEHPATPSPYDRAIAWEQYSYIIVSISQGKVAEINSWLLDQKRQFCQEQILIINV